ncbi:hypothetical protein [Actinocrispum sp. NPDC049592]|uniref:hypothetical protein n=1 Tax=Actinocrispum sp. NPDC049592 TaxID=3154835 RepID=UPI003433CD49
MIQFLTDYTLDEIEDMEYPSVPVGHDGALVLFHHPDFPDFAQVKYVTRTCDWSAGVDEREENLHEHRVTLVEP